MDKCYVTGQSLCLVRIYPSNFGSSASHSPADLARNPLNIYTTTGVDKGHVKVVIERRNVGKWEEGPGGSKGLERGGVKALYTSPQCTTVVWIEMEEF